MRDRPTRHEGRRGDRLRIAAAVWALVFAACGGMAASESAGPGGAVGSAAASVARPFAAHLSAYQPGSIQPSQVSQADLDATTGSFYDAWKATFVVAGCGGYYVRYQGPEADAITASENMGYGMMIEALMAGYDPAAQATFDGLYQFVRNHPSLNDPNLMAWAQGPDCQTLPDGEGPASDGDIDIAYALLLADRQWGSAGAVDYRSEAQARMAAIGSVEIEPSAVYVRIGDPAILPQMADASRSSDWIVDHFRAFAKASGEPGWNDVVERSYTLVQVMQSRYSPGSGLLPDFVRNAGTDPVPSGPNFLEGPYDGDYYYNACRDPWRLGTDYLVNGDPRALDAVRRLNAFFRSATGDDPSAITNGYDLAGVPVPDAGANDMAFVAPLAVAAMVDAGNQAWLDRLWDSMVSRPVGGQDGYFGNTLKLLSMIVVSGNWWAP